MSEIVKTKEALEREILGLLIKFEEDQGVEVTDIYLETETVVGFGAGPVGRRNETTEVKITCQV